MVPLSCPGATGLPRRRDATAATFPELPLWRLQRLVLCPPAWDDRWPVLFAAPRLPLLRRPVPVCRCGPSLLPLPPPHPSLRPFVAAPAPWPPQRSLRLSPGSPCPCFTFFWAGLCLIVPVSTMGPDGVFPRAASCLNPGTVASPPQPVTKY